MPYRWHDTAPEQSGAVFHLEIWPHRSLPPRGFAWAIGLAAAALALPMLAVLGTAVLWGLLPFAAVAVGGLWVAMRRSYRAPREELWLSPEHLRLLRRDPGRPDRLWETNPYWLRLRLRQDGPVEDYLTLTDGQREIELGAFLAPEERVALHGELGERLRQLR